MTDPRGKGKAHHDPVHDRPTERLLPIHPSSPHHPVRLEMTVEADTGIVTVLLVCAQEGCPHRTVIYQGRIRGFHRPPPPIW